jgi:peptidoglycan/LPS O-acetylase OafA/YrhL
VFLCDRRWLLRVCCLGLVTAPAIRVGFHLVWWPEGAYVLLPARVDALLLGALLAGIARDPGGLARLARWARPAIVVTGGLLVGLWLWRGGLDVYDRVVGTIGYSVLALFFAALIALAITADPARWFGRAAASPTLRFFGRYSYAIYVFHHPILVLLPSLGVTAALVPTVAGWRVPGYLLVGAIALAVTTALALVSWVLCERPFLRLKDRFTVGTRSAPAREVAAVPGLTVPAGTAVGS